MDQKKGERDSRSDFPTQRPNEAVDQPSPAALALDRSPIVPDEFPEFLERPTPVVSDAEELAIWMSVAASQSPIAASASRGLSNAPVEQIERSKGMYRFFLAGDRSGAAKLAEQILADRPHDAVAASVFRQCLASSDFEGAADGVLEVLVPLASLSPSDLDPRESGVLSRINGVKTVNEVLDAAGPGRADELWALQNLASRGIVGLRRRPGGTGA